VNAAGPAGAVMTKAVVIGIGNDHRRDDGVGPAVAAAVAAERPDVPVVICAAEPTAILDAWEGATLAVIVDAAAGDDAIPGRVRRSSLDDLTEPAMLTSHDLGLAQTYELGRVLDRAPQTVVVVAVDAADGGHGIGLSPAVSAAVPHAVAVVLAELAQSGRAAGGRRDVSDLVEESPHQQA
jgi:hydrogenase maturation protease